MYISSARTEYGMVQGASRCIDIHIVLARLILSIWEKSLVLVDTIFRGEEDLKFECQISKKTNWNVGVRLILP